jgi:hypothetical protein
VGGTSALIQEKGRLHGYEDREATITILDAESTAILSQARPHTRGLVAKEWLQRLSWSPGGEHIGFSAGKGYVGGVLRVKDMKTSLCATEAASPA